MAAAGDPGQLFFDVNPEYGSFQSQDKMPTWKEVMELLTGRPDESLISDDEWERRRLSKFQAQYLLPSYDAVNDRITVGTKKFENLKIPEEAKTMIRVAYEETCWAILDVILFQTEKKLGRAMSTALMQPFYNAWIHTKEVFQRTKDPTNYVVHFTSMEQEVRGIICILKACIKISTSRGKSNKFKDIMKKYLESAVDSGEANVEKVIRKYKPRPCPNVGENPTAHAHLYVPPDILKEVSLLALPPESPFYDTDGRDDHIEPIMELLGKMEIRKDGESNLTFVERVGRRIKEKNVAHTVVDHSLLVQQGITVPQYLKNWAVEKGYAQEGSSEVEYLKVIDKVLYNDRTNEITNKSLEILCKYYQDLEARTTHENKIKKDIEEHERINAQEARGRYFVKEEPMATQQGSGVHNPQQYQQPPLYQQPQQYQQPHQTQQTSRERQSSGARYGPTGLLNSNNDPYAARHVPQSLTSSAGDPQMNTQMMMMGQGAVFDGRRDHVGDEYIYEDDIELAIKKVLGATGESVGLNIGSIAKMPIENPYKLRDVRAVPEDLRETVVTLMGKSNELWSQIKTIHDNVMRMKEIGLNDSHYSVDMKLAHSNFQSNNKDFLKIKSDFEYHYLGKLQSHTRYKEVEHIYTHGLEELLALAREKEREHGAALQMAQDYFYSQNISSIKITDAEAKLGIPEKFTGEFGIGRKSFWEFIEKVEEYSKKNRYADNGKIPLLRKLLGDEPAIVVNDEHYSYIEMVRLLARSYGEFEYVFECIMRAHKRSAKEIPSTNSIDGGRSTWKERATSLGQHLELVDRAENLNKYFPGKIYCTRYAKALCAILPPDEQNRFAAYTDSRGSQMVHEIKIHLKAGFAAARKMQYSSNRNTMTRVSKKPDKKVAEKPTPDHSPAPQKGEARKKEDKGGGKVKKKSFAVNAVRQEMKPYNRPPDGENKPMNGGGYMGRRRMGAEVKIQTNHDCKFCKACQDLGILEDYYVNHIFQENYIQGHCPVYIKANPKQRRQACKKANLCDACLKEKDEDVWDVPTS